MLYRVKNNKVVNEERDVKKEIYNFMENEEMRFFKELRAAQEFKEKGKYRKLKK